MQLIHTLLSLRRVLGSGPHLKKKGDSQEFALVSWTLGIWNPSSLGFHYLQAGLWTLLA